MPIIGDRRAMASPRKKKFREEDVVWAVMNKDPPWPAKVNSRMSPETLWRFSEKAASRTFVVTASSSLNRSP